MQHIERPYVLAKMKGNLFLGKNRSDLTVTKIELRNVRNLPHQFHPFFYAKIEGKPFFRLKIKVILLSPKGVINGKNFVALALEER